jgi:precorrin-8X/cobalt-precorrin-8 methylmutase
MNTEAWKIPPQEIEKRSFDIIDQEAGAHGWDQTAWTVVRRLIHTSADFDYVKDTVIKPGSIESGVSALKGGALILTDTKMALNGINKPAISPYGAEVACLVDDERVKARAKETGSTRAQTAVDVAIEDYLKGSRPVVWVFGNAPTALYRLIERMSLSPELPRPALVCGFPVGFVNAYESKKELSESALPYFFTNLSRKGGSNIAAASINALAKLIS